MTYGTPSNKWVGDLATIIDQLLFDDWDPIGVNCFDDWPRDEYRGYAGTITRMAIAGKSIEDIAAKLEEFSRVSMGMTREKMELHLHVAQEIVLATSEYTAANPKPE